MKRTGLKVSTSEVKEVQKAAKSGDLSLSELRECARKWDAANPDAPAGLRTDA